jgi:adenosylcobinamide-phosphate synthase
MNPFWLFAAALALDLGFGDPAWDWHPVRVIGRLIKASEAGARAKGNALKRRGVGLLFWVAGLTWITATAVLRGLAWVDGTLHLRGWLALAGAALLLKSSFAIRDLLQHARVVLEELELGDLTRARLAVSRIVGRDVSALDERGVRRACLESVAESLGDGVVAPLFYACLGGPALALAYRAVNTLDSMVGYKDEHYRELGWASARMDDLLNFIPARLSVGLTMLAAWALGLNGWAALRVARLDGPRQPSPNAGWPEGAFAGALGVQLGGPVSYRGRASDKPTLGEARRPLDAAASALSLRLYTIASLLALLLCASLARADVNAPQSFTCTASDGVRIAASWYTAGTGTARPLVVQMPGFAQRRGLRPMRLVTSLLTPTADVLLIDARGTGDSQGLYTFGAEEHQDIAAALDALPRRYKQVAFLGFSLGAYIALRAATEGGLKPWRLLLVSCPTRVDEIVSSGGAFLNPLAMPFQNGPFAVKPQDDIFFRWGPIFLPKPSAVALVPALECPTAFLSGARDKLVFNSLSQAVYDAAPQPKTWDLWADGLHADAMALQHPAQFQAWMLQALK